MKQHAKFTHHEKVRCLEYELRRRQRVFGALVEEGRMRPEKADREVELLAEIIEDYYELRGS